MSWSFLCPGCGAGIEQTDLSCRACLRLVHATELTRIAAEAEAAAKAANPELALSLWQKALALLPRETTQHRAVEERIRKLNQELEVRNAHPQSAWKKASAGLGPAALLIWKFKAFGLLLLTKGKLLLLGLTKIGTLLSMFAAFGVYWALYGWRFALGLILSIYIHEMGHVIELRRSAFRREHPCLSRDSELSFSCGVFRLRRYKIHGSGWPGRCMDWERR